MRSYNDRINVIKQEIITLLMQTNNYSLEYATNLFLSSETYRNLNFYYKKDYTTNDIFNILTQELNPSLYRNNKKIKEIKKYVYK